MSSSPDRTERPPSALDGVVVLDLSTSVAGQYAGRMLAMNGADVVLVEPPGGTPTRRRGPRTENGSFLFRHLNQGKRSILHDGGSPADRRALRELVGRADVVVRDQGTDAPDGAGDRLVDCVVGDAPEGGAYGGWRFSEMIHQALAGAMKVTGELDREPVYGLGERASYATGTTAYISVVSALYERRRSGSGQRVDATVYESLAAMGQNIVSTYSYNGTHGTRQRYPGFLAMLRCADAWIVLFVIRNWPTVCRVLDCEHLLDDERYRTSADRLRHWEEIVAVLQERAATRRADEVVEGCQRGRVSAEKVTGLRDLLESEQWRVRRVMSRVGGPGGTEPAVRSVFTIDGAATEVRSASPRLPARDRRRSA
ncbi:CaiB/BaiF CoA-transferase family protein [Actinomadura sp. WMMB 499]|uniref:CaiB/BaiF CoA transferase family protein n=1 Tax=Actinomadura sp. WMMB 499 TaxID=1219491 RepID=UPI00159DE03D|nr:CoA transferase [Actinomadura sp. WMMB 499]